MKMEDMIQEFRVVDLAQCADSVMDGTLWDKRVTGKTKQDIYKTIKILYYMIKKYGILK
jgi:hypothetical protein